MPEKRVRPKNRPLRISANAAIVPSIVATTEEKSATFSVTHAASRNASFCSNSPYHRVEKPAQTVTSFDALKLYITNINIGTYRKAKPNVSETTLKRVSLNYLSPVVVAHFFETIQSG